MVRYLKQLLASVLIAAPAFADCLPSVDPGCIHKLATDPTAQSVIQGGNSGARFEATRDKSKVDAFIGYELTDQAGTYLKVSAPVKEQAEQKEWADLSGLASGTNVSAGLYGIIYQPSADPIQTEAICQRYRDSAEYKENTKNPSDPKKFVCSIGTLPEPYKTEYGRAVHWGPMPEIGGIQLTASTNEYKYFNGDHSSAKKTEAGYGAKVGVGRFPRTRVYYAGIDLAYEHAFKAADDVTLCTPVNSSTTLQCTTQGKSAPTQKDNLIATLELRTFLGAQAGLIPRLHYEFRKRDFSFELPIYFLRAEKGGFNGGLSLAWQPEAKGPAFTANIFFGVLGRAGRFWEN